jgi:hypothetical protein
MCEVDSVKAGRQRPAQIAGIRAVLLHAMSDDAKRFYARATRGEEKAHFVFSMLRGRRLSRARFAPEIESRRKAEPGSLRRRLMAEFWVSTRLAAAASPGHTDAFSDRLRPHWLCPFRSGSRRRDASAPSRRNLPFMPVLMHTRPRPFLAARTRRIEPDSTSPTMLLRWISRA